MGDLFVFVGLESQEGQEIHTGQFSLSVFSRLLAVDNHETSVPPFTYWAPDIIGKDDNATLMLPQRRFRM